LAKCKAVGMNDYLAKPIDERVLYSKIVSILKKPKLTKVNTKLNENREEKEIAKKKIKYTDLVYLNQRTKSNPKLMMEMISLYLAQTPPLITTIKQSLAEKNWTLLGAAAHKIIPSFAIMGMSPDFENMAKKIQDSTIAQEKTDEIADLVLELEKICLQACIELQEEFNTIKNTI